MNSNKGCKCGREEWNQQELFITSQDHEHLWGTNEVNAFISLGCDEEREWNPSTDCCMLWCIYCCCQTNHRKSKTHWLIAVLLMYLLLFFVRQAADRVKPLTDWVSSTRRTNTTSRGTIHGGQVLPTPQGNPPHSRSQASRTLHSNSLVSLTPHRGTGRGRRK